MGVVTGNKTRVYLNGFDLSGYLNKAGVAATADKQDNTRFGTNSKAYAPGALLDATVNGEGFFEYAATVQEKASHEALKAALDAADGVWTYLPSGDVFAADALCVSGVETDYEISASVGALQSLKATAQSSVGMEAAKVLHPLTGEAATGGDPDLDNGAVNGATANGGAAYLHVTDVQGGGTVAVKVQHSADGVTWTDLGSFAAAAAAGAQRIAFAGTIQRHVRGYRTLAGGATDATYQLAFARG